MGVKERREREKTQMVQRIMDAARAIFVAEGYDKVSMRRLAEAIEYSPAAIYDYFPDKESLFRAICTDDFGKLAKAFNELSRISDSLSRLKEIGRAYVRFAVKHPQHYRMMFMTPHPHDVHNEESLAKRGDPEVDSYAFLRRAVQEALDAGHFRKDLNDADLIAQVLWAAVHGVASCEITHADDPWIRLKPLDQRTDLMLDATMRGLLRENEKTIAPRSRR